MPDLVTVDALVARRAEATLSAYPDWPCRKGCDECCRNLGRVPVLTQPEWMRLRQAFFSLAPHVRDAVRTRMRDLAARPIVCPLLDLQTGACLTYDARPVACRTYGFYSDREGGLYCGRVAAFAADNGDILWGNQEAVERRLDALGIRRTLTEWFLDDAG